MWVANLNVWRFSNWKKTKTIAYVKIYDGHSKWMYFLIGDDDLLEKYNTVWDKVYADIEKEFDSNNKSI